VGECRRPPEHSGLASWIKRSCLRLNTSVSTCQDFGMRGRPLGNLSVIIDGVKEGRPSGALDSDPGKDFTSLTLALPKKLFTQRKIILPSMASVRGWDTFHVW